MGKCFLLLLSAWPKRSGAPQLRSLDGKHFFPQLLQGPSRGLYFGPKTIIIPPPSEIEIFSPSRVTSFFDSQRGLYALILPILHLFYPFTSSFLIFFPLSSFSFLFSFSFTLLPFFSSFFHIFSPKWHRPDIPPPRGGYFPIYRPLGPSPLYFYLNSKKLKIYPPSFQYCLANFSMFVKLAPIVNNMLIIFFAREVTLPRRICKMVTGRLLPFVRALNTIWSSCWRVSNTFLRHFVSLVSVLWIWIQPDPKWLAS